MSMKERSLFRKTGHPRIRGGYQGWERAEVADTLNVYDNTELRTPMLIVETYDARGNGDGQICNSIVGGASRQSNGLYGNSVGKE